MAELIVNGPWLDAQDYVLVQASAQVSPGVSFVPESAYVAVASFPGDSDPGVEITSGYEFVHGPLRAGSRIFVRARQVNYFTGLASDWIECNAKVT